MGQVANNLSRGSSGQLIFRPSIEVQSNGTPEAAPGLLVWRDDGILQANITSLGYNLAGGGTFHANFARGTRTAPAQVLAGDISGGIGSRCYDGVAFQTSSPAAIHWQVTENQTPAAQGMWMRWLSTPKGSAVRQERGGVTDNGTIWSHDTATYDPTSDLQTKPTPDALFVASATAPTTNGAAFVAVGYGATPTAGFRGLTAGGGTAAAPTATQNADTLCFLGAHGYTGAAFTAGSKALLAFRATQAWTAANNGCEASIEVTPNGSTVRAIAGQFNISAVAEDMALLLLDITAGTVKRVTRGAANSGGAGFRLLLIAN